MYLNNFEIQDAIDQTRKALIESKDIKSLYELHLNHLKNLYYIHEQSLGIVNFPGFEQCL